MSIKYHLSKSRLSSNWCAALGLFALVGCIGCGAPEAPTSNDPASPANSSLSERATDLVALNQAGDPAAVKLVGVWLGEAFLDQAQFEQQLVVASESQQKLLLDRAQTFLSTVMAVDFRLDGTLENDIELTPAGGQTMRDGSTGTWRVVKAEAETLIVETTTQLGDGTVTTDQQLYRFYPDGNRVALAIPMKDELARCTPLMVFTRQPAAPIDLASKTDATSQR